MNKSPKSKPAHSCAPRSIPTCWIVLLLLPLLAMPATAGAPFTDANWISMPGVTGEYASVWAAVVNNRGNLYIGGHFESAGGTVANNIAKWNGSRWSPLGSGVSGLQAFSPPIIYALAVSGNDLYAAGNFTNAGGVAASNIAKWNGSSWSALGSGVSGPPGLYPATVYALAMSGSDLYVGGYFTSAGGIAASNIAKWDGSRWSALGSGADYSVNALAVSGSNLYAGGYFTTAGGPEAKYVAKWNGNNWSALGSGLPEWAFVNALAISGSDLYAAGDFYSADSTPPNDIFKWDGSSWSAVGSWQMTTNFALAVSGSDLYVGGFFTNAATGANNIAKWDGSSWSALGSGIDGPVYALAVSGNDLYAGGQFTTAGGKRSTCIAHAYLPGLPALSTLSSGTDFTFSWPSPDSAGFALEQTDLSAGSVTWVPCSVTVTDDGTNKSVIIPRTNSAQFFRLRRP